MERSQFVDQRGQNMTHPFRVIGKLCNSAQSIQKQTPHSASADRYQQLRADFVERSLCRRLPKTFDNALVEMVHELKPEGCGLGPDASRSLVEAEKKPSILRGALAKKMQAERRLSDSRRSQKQRGGCPR